MLGTLRRMLMQRRLLVLLGALVVSVACVPGTALCVGSDGHLAIEAAGSACGSLHETEAAPEGGTVDASQALHGCVDTPLGAPSMRSPTDPHRALHLALSMAPIGLVPASPSLVAARQVGTPPLGSSAAKLSTVLLL